MSQQSNWRIEFFVDKQGRSPVEEFLNDLPVKERAKAERLIQLLRQHGHKLELFGGSQVKALKGHKPLKELRPVPNRVIYFIYENERIILLHGFKKKSNKTPQREIKKAESRMDQFLDRQRKG